MPVVGERRLSGVVLAGGASRRMGRDKALIDFEGEPLAARVARRLAEACDDVVVAPGDGRRLAWLGLPQVADVAPGAGPLGGIVAGLESARRPLVAVVAVDMPYVHAGVLAALAEVWAGEPAVVPLVAGRLEPLHAVYCTSAAGELRALLEAGQRSVAEALRVLGARVVPAADLGRQDPGCRFALSLNRPEDLRGGFPDPTADG
jgi:molybdopterin-guanine dinucleotide biosynthesis protein A